MSEVRAEVGTARRPETLENRPSRGSRIEGALADRRFLLMCDAQDVWRGDGLEFCRANEISLFYVAQMAVGDERFFGGGAAPIYVLRRIS